jgi:uncharacterized peroxidase-related enzyme
VSADKASDTSLGTTPEDVEAALRAVEEAGGFIPNSFYVMARRPRMLELITELCLEVLVREGRVTNQLRWLVAHIASRTAGCRYCWAHTASNASRLAGVDPEKIERAWEFQTNPLFDDAERAAMELALAAAQVPSQVTKEHLAAVRLHFDEDQLIDIMSVIALFGWFNRWNDTMATQLEDEPLEFARQHLESSGWTPGRHVTPD